MIDNTQFINVLEPCNSYFHDISLIFVILNIKWILIMNFTSG